MSILEVRDLVVTYGTTTAVDRISFRVEEGEFITLLGPSGCGKTTTLRCIAGLEPASSGEILIDGIVVSSAEQHIRPEKRDINMVFQSYAVWPHMSVFDNVAYGLRVRKLPRVTVREQVENALSLVGLQDFAKRFGTELSGGQQQRVALARAIVTEPKIILFDEPLSNLDAGLRERMRHELAELQRRIGRTAIYVTHDQSEAMVMSDRIVLMKDGKIEQEGTPREVYRRPSTRFAGEFVGAANVLTGRIAANNGHRAVVDVGNGLLVQVDRSAGLSAREGDEIIVMIRPEDIAVGASDQAGSDNRWEAMVRRVAFVGSKLELDLDVSGVVLRAEVPNTIEAVDGETVLVNLDPKLVIWLDDLSGEVAARSKAVRP